MWSDAKETGGASMIKKENFITLNMLKKEIYSGSLKGMRFCLALIGIKPMEQIGVTIWPEPYNFEKTPIEKKQTMEFEYSEQGIQKAVEWLDEQYELQKPLWDLSTTLSK